jgi:flotillin
MPIVPLVRNSAALVAQESPALDANALLAIGAAVAFAVALLVLLMLYRAFLYICRPNELLIVSGRRQRLAHGGDLDFTVVQAGRVWRRPFLERVARMDMRLIPVTLEVKNAYSKGNVALTVHAVANVKITGESEFVHNAVERFLGFPLTEIRAVAQQTLEGALREVLSQLTPEEVNEDRLKFADALVSHTLDDFNKLGLHLDTLKIQRVEDDGGYLQNLSRTQIAEKLRDAKIVESQANQEVAQEEAGARQRAELAKKEAEIAVTQKRNGLRTIAGQLEGEAKAVELEAAAATEGARATAEQELQTVRKDLETKRLHAEIVLPAEANRRAAELLALGDASLRREQGAANAEVMKALTEALAAAGPNAREMFVLSQLDTLVAQIASRLKTLTINQVHVIDNGDGTALPALAASVPAAVAAVLGTLKDLTGVDVAQLLSSSGTGAVNGGGSGHAPIAGARAEVR